MTGRPSFRFHRTALPGEPNRSRLIGGDALSCGRQAAGRRERGQGAICQINLEDPDLAGASLNRIQEARAAFCCGRQIIWPAGGCRYCRDKRDTWRYRVTGDAEEVLRRSTRQSTESFRTRNEAAHAKSRVRRSRIYCTL
jgi:hypothetical protein